MEKFLKWLFSPQKHECPVCKTELDCYGSYPWGLFNYKCEKCGYKEPEFPER